MYSIAVTNIKYVLWRQQNSGSNSIARRQVNKYTIIKILIYNKCSFKFYIRIMIVAFRFITELPGSEACWR